MSRALHVTEPGEMTPEMKQKLMNMMMHKMKPPPNTEEQQEPEAATEETEKEEEPEAAAEKEEEPEAEKEEAPEAETEEEPEEAAEKEEDSEAAAMKEFMDGMSKSELDDFMASTASNDEPCLRKGSWLCWFLLSDLKQWAGPFTMLEAPTGSRH